MSEKRGSTVLALFVTILVDALGWGIAFPILTPIILNNSTHLFNSECSLATRNFLYELSLGIYCLFMFLMSPVLGSLSDKYGRKKVLIISMLGNFVGFFVSGLAVSLHSFAGILLGRSIAGATAGSLPIAQAAMIDISEESQKASRLGLVILANVSGFAIGPVIGGLFMDPAIWGHHVIYQVPFFISCAMGLMGALLLFIGFKETFHGDRSLKINLMTGFDNLREAFTDKKTLSYCLVLTAFLLAWAMFFSTMPVLLTERVGWQASSVAYFITYIAVIFAFVIVLIMPKVTAKYPLAKVVLAAMPTMFLCNVLFSTVHNSIVPWFIITLAIAVPFTYVGTVTILSMQVDSQKQGQIMGVTGSIFALTWGVGPILAGYVLRSGFTVPYVLSGIFFALAILFFIKRQD